MNEWMNDLFNVEDVGSVYTIFRVRGKLKNTKEDKMWIQILRKT